MITSGDWLNPTRATGITAYAIAAACCGLAWSRTKTRPGALRLATVLTLIESVLLLDMIFNWRWMLHQLFMDLAQSAHEYDVRRIPQAIVVTILGVLLIVGLLAVRRWLGGRPGASLAVSGALLSLVLWCVEVVSLHQVDHILYHSLGKLMAVSLLWILASGMTSIGILLDSYRVGRSVEISRGRSAAW
jgi:hypothetical protein